MARTTDKAEKILDFVNDFLTENGYAPSVREIGKAVGLNSTASVSYHLRRLEEQGFLRSGDKGCKRSVVTAARQGQIPIIGAVRAGMPNLAVEDWEGSLPWNGDSHCFALRVVGDSMIGAHIMEDDLVVVRPQPTAEDGQIVVARFEGNATVKTFRRKNGKVWLQPENDAYPLIDGADATVIGIVKAVVRQY